MMPYPMAATRAGKAIGAAYTYLLGPFRFTTDQAAPLTSPYTEGGAVGSLTVTDSANIWSVNGGTFRVNGTPGTANETIRITTAITRQCGRTVLLRIVDRTTVSNFLRFGLSTAINSSGGDHMVRLDTTSLIKITDATFSQYGDWTQAGDVEIACVLRSVGAFWFGRIAGGAAWTLLFVQAIETSGPLYAKWAYSSNAFTPQAQFDNLRIIDLNSYDSRFATDEGSATDRKATNSAGDTIVMVADAWVEQTLTAATGVDKDLYVRWTDDNNCWIVRQNQAGSTVKLVEKVAGVETSRLSAAQTFTNGTAYRLIAICDGTTITVYVQNMTSNAIVKAGAYASATTNQTATTAKAPSAGTELKSYRRFYTLPAGI